MHGLKERYALRQPNKSVFHEYVAYPTHILLSTVRPRKKNTCVSDDPLKKTKSGEKF